MKIGIDKIGFAAPNYVLDLEDLAQARNVDPNKFKRGLLQSQMAVAPVTQDMSRSALRLHRPFSQKRTRSRLI